MAIRETSDSGEPIVVSAPESAHAKVFLEIAERVWATLSDAGHVRRAPKIVVE